jgi:polyhydroxybutyrate depolymerase
MPSFVLPSLRARRRTAGALARAALALGCTLGPWPVAIAPAQAALTPAERAEERALPEKGRIAAARSRHLSFGGLDRSYLVQPVPAERDTGGPHPVVVLLHGGTQTAADAWRDTSLPTLAEREGFILVAPQGAGRHWNDARGSTISGDAASNADDVGFLKAVIAEVLARDHGDASAVFMVGASNGGFMTMRFACDAGETLRAAASVISTVPEALARNCRSPRPLPWLAINGTDDPLIPFAGQPEGTLRRGVPQPVLRSADETFRFWADRAGCAPQLLRTDLTEASQDDRRRWAESIERHGCAGGQVSRQVVLHGSGHVFPGMAIGMSLVERVVGPGAPEIDGGTLIWEFFKATLLKG